MVLNTLKKKEVTIITRILVRWKLSTLYKFIRKMEKLNLGYSSKNIPIPTSRNYKLQLIEKTELFIKKSLWKAIFYDMKLNKNKNNNIVNNMKDSNKSNGGDTLKENS